MTPEEVMARHARSFAPAARLLAAPDRARIARLYALCRTVDDLADTVGGPDVAARLTRLAASLEDAQSREPLAIEARALFSGRHAGLVAFRHLVETVAQDTGDTQIADEAALESYCHGVAGTVGLMVCALFDIAPRWHRAAADLGKAMQVTNICRDVLADAEAGRRYLPATLCPHSPAVMARAAGEDAEVAADIRAAVAHLLARADALYASGRAGLPALPLRLRLAVAAAATMYAGIGDGLRARHCDPLQGRVYVPASRKARLASAGILSTLWPVASRQHRGRHAAT